MPVAGCSNDEEKKYDVAIRVACSDGTVYEFPVGKEEKHITIPYDGTKRTFKVKEYRLEGYSDHWLDIVGPNDYKFDITYLQYIGGENYAVLDSINGISEKGSYIIQIIQCLLYRRRKYILRRLLFAICILRRQSRHKAANFGILFLYLKKMGE